MVNDIGNVLRLWYLIEMLSPQAVKFRDVDREDSRDFTVQKGRDLPWSVLHARQESLFESLGSDGAGADDAGADDAGADDAEGSPDNEQTAPEFLIYLGISRIAHFDRAIVAAAGVERSSLDLERESKELCAFATIQLSEAGVYIEKSLVVSTLPWGLQQLRALNVFDFVSQPKPEDFDEFADRLRDTIPLPRSKPLTAEDLVDAAEFILDSCALRGVIPFTKAAHGTFYRLGSKEPLDLLNSFYYKDIIRAMQLHASESLPAILQHIFEEPRVQARIELFHDAGNLRRLLNPADFSAGAWPNLDMKPALMQQAALALTRKIDARIPVLAVNGPPGTGKTTMIRSFLADRLVERAKQMCRYDDPSVGWQFVPDAEVPESGYYRPPADVTGFEIIVASSNNGAVENISDELPDVRSVAGYAGILTQELQNYFLPVARNVAAYRAKREKREVWGLIAASLGNKKKRKAFIEPFLYNETSRKRPPGHLTIREFHRGRWRTDWGEVRADFLERYERFERLRASASVSDAFWHGDIKARHDEVPGLEEELLLLQHELFVKALRVHRSYIARAWSRIGSNLNAWAKVTNRPELYPAEKALALWQTLFLIVPVVSTTFASAGRMLGRVEGLGWGVVDEAGQAVPQAALALFMKVRRAIVIGDPLQLEPVVTLSSAVIRTFRKLLHVEAQWVAANDTAASLQTIVERASPWGSNRKTKFQFPQWIGVPLVVHRRCLEPMFSVANEVVYGGDMLFRTAPEPRLNLYPFGESAWIDERSPRTGRHAVDAQIELTLTIVRMTFEHYAKERANLIRESHGRVPTEEMTELKRAFAKPDIRVVTPFREIEERFGVIARRTPGQSARWCEDHVGTVHKMQGKEAGLVICVLGLDSSTSGAADFATEKPNFLNVAITRAKHRLYVIGSAPLWGRKDYFSELFSALDRRDGVVRAADFLARCARPGMPSVDGTESRLRLLPD